MDCVNTKRGVLLLATGYPYYGRMAYNLAITIKAIDKSIPITIAHSGNALNHIRSNNMWVFDDILEVPENENNFYHKLMIDQYTQYDETLFIDADCVWINKESPSTLFNQLANIEFTGITEGYHDFDKPEKSEHGMYYFWADVNEMGKKYNLTGKLYQWRSEFIYFKTTDNVKKMFSCARDIYNCNTGMPAKNESYIKLDTIQKFADTIPDELAFNIATNIHGIKPHVYKWKPSYWSRLHYENVPEIEQLRQYYVFSCGSNASSGSVKRVYDRIVKASAYKLGLQYTFPLVSKKEALTTRQKM